MGGEHKNVDNSHPRPFWIPPGVDPEDLPEGLQAAIDGAISPAYQRLVVAARAGVEQSTGITITGLLWLECLEYFEVGQNAQSENDTPELEKREASMARLLRLAGAKLRASDFLLRVTEARRRWAKESGLPALPSGGDVESGV